jgi:hypothetical protein
MIKRNDQIVATAEQNIVITQAEYDKLNTSEQNNPLKTYFISDGAASAQSLNSENDIAVMALNDDVAEATGAMEEDPDLAALRISELLGYAPMLKKFGTDGTIMGAIKDLYTRLGVKPAEVVEEEETPLTYADYVAMIGDTSVLKQFNAMNITAALADLFKRVNAMPATTEEDSSTEK